MQRIRRWYVHALVLCFVLCFVFCFERLQEFSDSDAGDMELAINFDKLTSIPVFRATIDYVKYLYDLGDLPGRVYSETVQCLAPTFRRLELASGAPTGGRNMVEELLALYRPSDEPRVSDCCSQLVSGSESRYSSKVVLCFRRHGLRCRERLPRTRFTPVLRLCCGG